MILVLAGTSEGRQSAIDLEKESRKVMAATATAYGGELLEKDFQGEISTRPLGLEAMTELINRKDVIKVIDATHPFAEEVSKNAREACRLAGIEYERLEREGSHVEAGGGVIAARDMEEAVQIASGHAGNIFLTVGSSKLEHYTRSLDPEKLIVRILPVKASLEKCLKLGIPPKNIIAMQGPFDEEINKLLFRGYQAGLVITKDSGTAGGVAEKITAARALNIPVILIARPQNPK